MPSNDFEFSKESNLAKYHGNNPHVAIPSEGAPLTIGAGAFLGNETMETLVIPEGVVWIRFRAFSGCVNLREVTLPASLQVISAGSFSSCPKLQNLNFPKGVHPQLLISQYAFANSPGLADENGFLIIDGAAYRCLEPSDVVTVTDGVHTLSRDLFHNCKNITEIRLPESLRKIHAAAFQGCVNLEHLKIPLGVEQISASAFKGCDKLYPPDSDFLIMNGWLCGYRGDESTVVIPEGVTRICGDVFSGRLLLKKVIIPKGVTSIGNGAFSGCVNLSEITLPKSLQHIGSAAFHRCGKLRIPPLPASLTCVEDSAFYGCAE